MLRARQKVFTYIKKHRAVTSAEIARDLRMTTANARHHLSLLKKDGRIEEVGKKEAGVKGGRPRKIYGITRHIRGDGLVTLSHHLLEEMLGAVNARQRSGILKNLARRLASSGMRETGARVASPMIRLKNTVQHLNKLGYESRWEAHAEGPRIILGQCPYLAIVGKHPELCEMDANLLAEYLGGDVNQIEKLAGEGIPFCVFGVR
ncbi:MAG: hypothetical protein HN392_04325 [Anaerolineae bacterium]|jgi:predicted ArsR family transcriptional regulator|nr:hypothetical protein [Anaerolineae bacterium]MBT7074149.1 hypothetical protein [Anaerolineae bacterium]MBT7783764.1 hypothetical protein [Anaerolineae bacterium]